MFIRQEVQNYLFKQIKSSHYINLQNVFRIEVEENVVKFFTNYRPNNGSFNLVFPSNTKALAFADLSLQKPLLLNQTVQPKGVDQLSQPSADPLALQAMADWENEQKMQ